MTILDKVAREHIVNRQEVIKGLCPVMFDVGLKRVCEDVVPESTTYEMCEKCWNQTLEVE